MMASVIVYVDKEADLAMAESIVINAKMQRPGVCNAIETLLVHRDIAGLLREGGAAISRDTAWKFVPMKRLLRTLRPELSASRSRQRKRTGPRSIWTP